MMPRMIVCDLDGTLLRDDKSLSDHTLQTLHLCGERGMKIVIATARSEDAAEDVIAAVAPHAVASGGGSIVRVGRDVIAQTAIPHTVADAVVRAALSDGRITEVMLFGEHKRLSNNPARPSFAPSRHYRYDDLSTPPQDNAYKITLFSDHPQAVESIVVRHPPCTLIRYTGEAMVAVLHRNATKQHAVRTLCAHWGIPIAQVVAFGDDHNDVGMLRECGVGVAMGNAIGPARAAADHLCDTNERDGVARWIEAHILCGRSLPAPPSALTL